MIKIRKDSLLSPQGIFFLYIFASAAVIMAFRLIFPGEVAVIPYFSFSWRLIQGFTDFLRLFPALVLSSLVIPYGFRISTIEKIKPFSPQFLQHIKSPIVTVIIASTIHGLLFFLVLPMAQNHEANLVFQSRLYRLAKEKAKEYEAVGEWNEAAQFVAICEKIWPKSPEMEKLKIEAEIRVQGGNVAKDYHTGARAESVAWEGVEPVSATEAFEMAETALAEERFFDAHWLATLGGRLAADGSPEKTIATRLTGRAWQRINSLAPTDRESRAFTIFRLKRDGHEALIGREWIRSYYIFLELMAIAPEDPDVAKYLSLSETGAKQVAFFIDEIELNLGKILTGAIFSLPYDDGRLVMRIASLSTFSDSAYGIGTEIMAFDRDGRPLWSMEAPFTKIMPLAIDSGYGVTVLLRALDRENKAVQWEPKFVSMGQREPGQRTAGSTEISLKLSWENFLLLSNVRRGLTGLSPGELRRAAENLANCGYLPQVFEAELLQRFTGPLLLLPLGILSLVIGWRYRALRRPRYMNIFMLGILPLVFNGVVQYCRGLLNNLGIMAVVSMGFSAAAICFGVGTIVLLFLSLIILAAQHS